MSAVSRRVLMPFSVILAMACGGDSNATGPTTTPIPQPPEGSATQVPRVLGLSTVNGKSVPGIYYQSADSQYNVKSDSGSATLQDDSLLVVRTYDEWILRRPGVNTGTLESFTGAGRLQPSGIAVFHYTDGTADTAHVLPNGGVVVTLTIYERTLHSFGTFTFTAPYTGATLNPVPYVTGIWPASAPVNADSATIVLTGSSFMPTTRLVWDQTSELKVTYVSANRISAVIPGAFLLSPASKTLTVINPPPGGGARVFAYDVTFPPATVSSISPVMMPANGGYFTLHIHGRGFTSSSRVMWNGVPRAPMFPGTGTDIAIDVPSSDIASPGTIEIGVQNPSGSQGTRGTSGTIPLVVTPSTAQKFAEITVPFFAGQLIADPVRSLVYATAGGYESTRANTVLAIDPTNGQVVWSLRMGAKIMSAAISDDGQYLYVGRGADSAIARIALATHTIDAKIPVRASSSSYGPTDVMAISVQPGNPHTIAVVANCECPMPSGAAMLSIYDDTVPRRNTVAGTSAPLFMAFTGSQAVTGVDPSGRVSDFVMDANGVTLGSSAIASLGTGGYFFAGHMVYTGQGVVYDATAHTTKTIDGFMAAPSVTGSTNGQLLYSTDLRGLFVRAYDPVAGVETGAVPVGSANDETMVGAMTRWGSDGLAFTTFTNVYFIRASFVH